MPEDAKLALVFANSLDRLQGVVDAQVLVIASDQLYQAALFVTKEREVFHDVEQAIFFTGAANKRFQRDDSRLFLVADLFPFKEMFPASRHTADPALVSIGEQDKGVVPEELRDGVFVVAQVIVKGMLQSLMRGFQLDQDQRQAVHKADQIRAALVDIPGNPHLRNEQEIVITGLIPVDDLYFFFNLFIRLVPKTHLYTILEHQVNLAVGLYRIERAAITHQFLNGLANGLLTQSWIELLESRPQARNQYHFLRRFAPQHTSRSWLLIKGVKSLIA